MKRALVTGASDGLGLHVANRLAESGWSVQGFGRRPQGRIQGDVFFSYFEADLAAVDGVDAIMQATSEPLDLVVHCAACYPNAGRGDFDAETVFRINTLNPDKLFRTLVSAQPPDRELAVIVVNSEAMFHASAQSRLYAASKAALRVLTTGLADSCRNTQVRVMTLLLGPLADRSKVQDLARSAEKNDISIEQITKLFLRRSNPDLVIGSLIDFESCFESIRYMAGLGSVANGMMCRLDGGSAGSLI